MFKVKETICVYLLKFRKIMFIRKKKKEKKENNK